MSGRFDTHAYQDRIWADHVRERDAAAAAAQGIQIPPAAQPAMPTTVRARILAIQAKGSAHVNNILREHGYKWRKADGWWHLFRADGTEVAPVGDQRSGLHVNALAEIDGDEGRKWLDGLHAHSKARLAAFRMARAASDNYLKAVQS